MNTHEGQILIECPNTIFHLYVDTEDELAKIEIFMNNIRSVSHMGLNDIYNWCNRQKIAYDTSFNFQRKRTLWKTIQAYLLYTKIKMKYQLKFSPV